MNFFFSYFLVFSGNETRASETIWHQFPPILSSNIITHDDGEDGGGGGDDDDDGDDGDDDDIDDIDCDDGLK